MQIIEEVSAQYGLAALLQEKPFNNVNGSGKHNNWSIGTYEGCNLLNVGQVAKMSGSTDIFPVVLASIVGAIDNHGDLLRMAIASPGNDFRLGACEAPPAIISTYLGDDMTSFLEDYAAGKSAAYTPGVKNLSMGVASMADVEIPAQDRNRTSPFPYGGHRFEFRAVGSAQNVSLVNTVLNTITANAFKKVSDRIDAGEDAKAIAADLIKTHVPKVVFNGDNYDEANQEMLTKRGVWRIDSGVEAICRYSAPKNTALFEEMKVLRAEECVARQTILLDHYVGTVEMEAKCMIEMINKHVIPSVKAAGVGPLADLEAAVPVLEAAVAKIHASEGEAQGNVARELRLETMESIRATCDAAEAVCPANLWTLPTYTDLLFLDQTSNYGSYEE